MGLNAAVQALKKAEPLKNKVQRYKDLLTDNDAWICQQQLQKIYQQVLILDLEYALDKKVEQELWNLGFKNYISVLQTQAKDRKNPKRSESQAMLSWCLEAASGFYLSLLQEICTAFDLDLPFRRKGYIYGCIPPWKAIEKLSIPHKSSCFYACQYCLVHLGDIARYRNQNRQAELFYRHAVSLSPSSGQPYNQLALLEASRGDKLGTVFNYVRSVAVRHPFPVATSNLAKTLASTLTDNSFNINEKTKLDSQEYVLVFLKLHGILHSLGDFKLAKNYVKILSETLTALVATESFSSWRLIQMLIINFYSLHHIAGHVFESSMDLMKVDQLSSDEKTARSCILDLIAASLSALLLPVYTIKNSYVEYFALPSIKLCLDWIRQQPIILEDTAFSSRLQIWPSLCVFLNGLQSSISDFNAENYSKIPLPEDRDLQGFLPLEKTFESLRFCNNELEGDTASLNKLRAARIINLGQYLALCQVNGASLLNVSGEKNQLKFTCMSDVSGPSNELMKELEELSLNKERQMIFTASPVPSESASSKGSSEPEITESSIFERRIGILKPEGPPGRGRDSLMSSTNNSDAQPHSNDINGVASTRKIRQNVAMQAIIKRAENEQKQVTFKNISPMIIEEIEVKKNPSIEANHAMNNVMNPMSSAHNTQNTPLLQPSVVPRELASILPKMIDKIDNPESQCFRTHEQNLQSPYESSEFINRSMNPQEPQFNDSFGINRMQIPQIPMPQSLQSIQRLPPPLIQPSSSSISHPNMMINLPQGVLYQRPTNPEFFDRNYRQQGVLMGIAPINDYNKVINVDENLQINRNGTNGMQVSYLKSVGQVGGNGLEFNKNLGQIPQNISYPNRMSMNDCSSPQQQANYSIYRNYESDFNPWKDNQLPPPPVTWWGNIGKDKPEINAFQSWVNTPGTTSIQAPIISNNETYQKSIIENSYVEENHCESDQIKGGNNTANTYSLFSGNSWGASVPSSSVTTQDQPRSRLTQQSLWSGPGPSPLERLLEQQKSLREGGT